jgi:hypothetical protein
MQVSHTVGAVAAVVGLLAGIVSPEGVVATAVESKDVARVLASKKTLRFCSRTIEASSNPDDNLTGILCEIRPTQV